MDTQTRKIVIPTRESLVAVVYDYCSRSLFRWKMRRKFLCAPSLTILCQNGYLSVGNHMLSCSVALKKTGQPTVYCMTDEYTAVLQIVDTVTVFFSYGRLVVRLKGPEKSPLPTKYKHLERSNSIDGSSWGQYGRVGPSIWYNCLASTGLVTIYPSPTNRTPNRQQVFRCSLVPPQTILDNMSDLNDWSICNPFHRTIH